MPLISAPRVGMSDRISLTPDGMFTFPRLVMDRLRWIPPLRVSIRYLVDEEISDIPLVLFLSADNSHAGYGYALSSLNKTSSNKSTSGAKTSCALLTRTVIAPRVELPRTDIEPIFMPRSIADLVIMLTEPIWQVVDFNMAGCNSIGADATVSTGVYELLGTDGVTLRVGEGNIQSRIREHLRDDKLVKSVRRVRYFSVTAKKDAETIEQVLLARFETRFGSLPVFNSIRA